LIGSHADCGAGVDRCASGVLHDVRAAFYTSSQSAHSRDVVSVSTEGAMAPFEVVMRRMLGLLSKVVLATVLTTQVAAAQDWPQKPVKILVGFAAGGNFSNLARITAARLSEVFGQQFIIENRAGAMGTLAGQTVVRSDPDGYTFFWAGTGTISIYPAMSKTPYDTLKDLAPVSVIGTSAQALVVNPKLPIHTVAEFVDYVKARPNQLAYAGGGGPGSVSNILMATFLKRLRLDMNAVSYRGSGLALTDVVGGHVPAMFIPLPEALPQAAGGNIRILAVADDRRSKHAPDVPTLAEAGFPGHRGVSWNGMLAPAGTPKDIVDRVAAEFISATKDPVFVAQLEKYGAEPFSLTPEGFRAFLERDMAEWADAVKLAGVELQ
jgi:tripartite-type tricarboxylate transporter receptor subunit TctC